MYFCSFRNIIERSPLASSYLQKGHLENTGLELLLQGRSEGRVKGKKGRREGGERWRERTAVAMEWKTGLLILGVLLFF